LDSKYVSAPVGGLRCRARTQPHRATVVIYAFNHFPEQTAWRFEVAPTELKYRVLDEHGSVLLASDQARDSVPWVTGDLSGVVDKPTPVTIGSKPFDIVTLRVPHEHTIF
jgi:hypothetical protein